MLKIQIPSAARLAITVKGIRLCEVQEFMLIILAV